MKRDDARILTALAFGLLALASVALAAAPDWQDQSTISVNEPFRMRDGNGVVTIANGYRAFIAGADSSALGNQADFTAAAACSCYTLGTMRTGAPLRSGRFDIYKISPGADSLLNDGDNRYIEGYRTGFYAVDDTSLATGAVGSRAVLDESLQAADIDTGAVGTSEIETPLTLPGNLTVGGDSHVTGIPYAGTDTLATKAYVRAAASGVADSSVVVDGSLSVNDLHIWGTGWTLKRNGTVAYWGVDSTGTGGGTGDLTGIGKIAAGMITVSDSTGPVPKVGLNFTQVDAAYVNEGQDIVTGTVQADNLEAGDASTQGAVYLHDGSSNYVIVQAPSTGANWTLTVPTNNGGAGEFLKTDGNGVTSWEANANGDITGVGVRQAGGQTLLAVADSASGNPTLSVNLTNADARWVNEAQANSVDSTMVSAIGSGDITDGQVKSADIQDATIVLADMAANSVDSTKVSSIGSGDITDGQVKPADLAGLTAADSLKLGTGSVTSTSIATGQVKSADIQDATIALADLAATAVDSSKVAAGALAWNDLKISGTATVGYVPKSTGTNGGVSWQADTGGTVDSSTVAAGTLARSDLAIGGTATAGYVPKSTGAGWAWAADATGALSLPLDSLRVTGPNIQNGAVRMGDAVGDSLSFYGTVAAMEGNTRDKGGIRVRAGDSAYSSRIVGPIGAAGNAVFALPNNSPSRYSTMSHTWEYKTAWTTSPEIETINALYTLNSNGNSNLGDAASDAVSLVGLTDWKSLADTTSVPAGADSVRISHASVSASTRIMIHVGKFSASGAAVVPEAKTYAATCRAGEFTIRASSAVTNRQYLVYTIFKF